MLATGTVITQSGGRQNSAASAPDPSEVTITTNANERIITANGIPNHITGQFPNRGNPNRISAGHYEFHMPLNPKVAEQPGSSKLAWFGVALNGVPFEPGTAEFWNGNTNWVREAIGGSSNLGLDQNNGHVQPNGAYHYHSLPTGLVAKLGGDEKRMLLVGWAADGFPIYTGNGHTVANDARSPLRKMRSSYRLKKGERTGSSNEPGGSYDGEFSADYEYVKNAGDLDECNGRLGVTPEFPQGIYHYYITEDFPFVSRYWRGTPDRSFMKPWPRPGVGVPGQRGPGRRGGPGASTAPGLFEPPPR